MLYSNFVIYLINRNLQIDLFGIGFYKLFEWIRRIEL